MIAWECVDNVCTLWLPDVGIMGQMIVLLGLAIAVLFAIMIITSVVR